MEPESAGSYLARCGELEKSPAVKELAVAFFELSIAYDRLGAAVGPIEGITAGTETFQVMATAIEYMGRNLFGLCEQIREKKL